MKNYLSLFVLLSFFSTSVMAQHPDVTGLWKGEIYVDSTKQYLPYEIAVSENKGKLTGYSRIIFVEEGKEEAGFENISLKWEGSKLIIEDEGFFEHSFSKKPSRRVKKEMTLSLETKDDEMILQGKWQTNRTRFYLVATGTTLLKRKKVFQETALFKKLDSLKIAPKLSFAQPDKMVAMAETPRKEITAVVQPVVEEKKETVPVVEPEEEVALLAPIGKLNNISLLPVPGKRQPAVVKIQSPTKEKRALLVSLAKSSVQYKTKEPIVAVTEKQPAPAITKQPAKEVVTKPAPVAKTITEKPAPAIVKNAAPSPEPKKETPVAAVAKPQPVTVFEKPSQQVGAAEIDKRVTKSDQSFYFESDSLLLTLYDNGEVDGDTVTVLMNGNVVFSKVGLTTRANSKTIYITPNMDSVNLVMYAESLGEIPPNTGLLIVNDGEKRYDVRFSADLKTNAAIILRRKKNE
jgi:hypothetical protein